MTWSELKYGLFTFLFVVVLLGILLLTSEKTDEQQEHSVKVSAASTSPYDGRMDRAGYAGYNFYVFIDKGTSCKYLVHHNSNLITPLLKADGTPDCKMN